MPMIDHENENIWKIWNHFWSSRPGSTILSCPIFRPPPFFTILHPEIFPLTWRRAYLADELIPQQNAGKSDSELSNCIVLKRQSNHNLPSFNELAIYQSHGCHTEIWWRRKNFLPIKRNFSFIIIFFKKRIQKHISCSSQSHRFWSQTTCSGPAVYSGTNYMFLLQRARFRANGSIGWSLVSFQMQSAVYSLQGNSTN